MNTQEIYQAAFEDELQKIAVKAEDVEEGLGTVFTKQQEQTARKLIDKEIAKSFILRHPLLTGIPTLGLLPYSAGQIAKTQTTKSLARQYPEIKKLYEKKIRAERAAETAQHVAYIGKT